MNDPLNPPKGGRDEEGVRSKEEGERRKENG